MSFAAINWAWEQLDLAPGPKVVLMGLAHVADDANMAWPSIGTLAVRANVSMSTVRRYLAELSSAGLISIENRSRADGSTSSNVYRLHVDTPSLPLGKRGREVPGADAGTAENMGSQIDSPPSQSDRGEGVKLEGVGVTADTPKNDLPITSIKKDAGADSREEGETVPIDRVFLGDVEVTSLAVLAADGDADSDSDDDPTDRGVWRPAVGRVPLDAGFRLPPEWRDYVCERYDLAPEQVASLAESFKVHWLEKGAAKVDWRAAFVEWVKTSIAMAAERQGKDGLAEVAARRGRSKRAGGKVPVQPITLSKPDEAHDMRFEHMRRGIVSQIGNATYASWIDKTAMRVEVNPYGGRTLVITCRTDFHADEVRKRHLYTLGRYAALGFGEGIAVDVVGPGRRAA
jgi:hypothetical protein